MSSRASSSSSAEYRNARPGDVVAGFRLGRLIGRGETGAVFEATQLSLGRPVALRLIDPAHLPDADSGNRFDRELRVASSLHQPGLVPVFEAGEWAGGRYVATRLIRGGDLRSASGGGARGNLEPVAAGLAAAHRAGLSHGAVRAENVLVDADGRAYLSDLGLGRGAGPDADLEGLAAIEGGRSSPPPARGPRKALVAAGAAGAAIALVVAALAVGGGSDDSDGFADAAPPPAPDGTEALGSDLASGPAGEVGCGEQFGGASSCTFVLGGAGGRPVRAAEDGAIRRWAVRGATGELTLQVLRPGGASPTIAGFSQPVEAPDRGPHAFAADSGVERGDLIAVKLGPGATLGRRTGAGNAFRWEGSELPLPRLADATVLEGEVLARADAEPGGRPSAPVRLLGAEARVAPAGTTLAETTVAISPASARQVRLVDVSGRINLDAFDGARRTTRISLADTNAGGELVRFEQDCGPARSVCLRWLNPGEDTPLVHVFQLTEDGRVQVIG